MTTTTVSVTRTVPAPPAEVFAAWTESDRLATWWWPHLPGTSYDVDASVGGHYRIEGPAIAATVSGVFTEVDPPRRLALTWVWQDDGEPASVEDTVVVSFAPDGDGTAVTVDHVSAEHVPDGGAEQGWSDVLDRLVEVAQASTSDRS